MTQDNPYQSPLTTPPVIRSSEDNRERLRAIASAHRLVNLAVLFYLCLIPFNVAIRLAGEEAVWAALAISLVALGVALFGAIAVFRLASLFMGTPLAVIYALGLLIPCVGLILLVLISQKATRILQQHGIKVGLLGADPSTI